MKASYKIKFGKKIHVIMAVITHLPGGTDEEFGDSEGLQINKDPIIGGADDVYRENPTDDLRDSDLVDAEPLQADIDHAERSDEQINKNHETEESSTPSDAEEENIGISNLEDSEDIIAED